MTTPEISLKEALYLHFLQMPNLEGLTTAELFQDERPIDMVDLKDKNRKIHLVIEKITDRTGTVKNTVETFQFRILGDKDNPITDQKMEMLKGILIEEFNGTWGYLAMDKFKISGCNYITGTENLDYETNEREIVLRFEFFYQLQVASGLNLSIG